jgi:hypothetical protein
LAVLTTARGPGSVAVAAEWSTAATVEGPRYTADGRLKLPEKYREWVFLSSGLDMSYTERNDKRGHSMFDNVFAEPGAYREFMRTGLWPDGTVLLLETRVGAEKGSINHHGRFQTGELMGIEAHVKDTKRFQGGWAFFPFQGTVSGRMVPMSEGCYSCHQQHAAVDTTFVQFYPTLLEVAKQKGTLSPGYKPEAPQ